MLFPHFTFLGIYLYILKDVIRGSVAPEWEDFRYLGLQSLKVCCSLYSVFCYTFFWHFFEFWGGDEIEGGGGRVPPSPPPPGSPPLVIWYFSLMHLLLFLDSEGTGEWSEGTAAERGACAKHQSKQNREIGHCAPLHQVFQRGLLSRWYQVHQRPAPRRHQRPLPGKDWARWSQEEETHRGIHAPEGYSLCILQV